MDQLEKKFQGIRAHVQVAEPAPKVPAAGLAGLHTAQTACQVSLRSLQKCENLVATLEERCSTKLSEVSELVSELREAHSGLLEARSVYDSAARTAQIEVQKNKSSVNEAAETSHITQMFSALSASQLKSLAESLNAAVDKASKPAPEPTAEPAVSVVASDGGIDDDLLQDDADPGTVTPSGKVEPDSAVSFWNSHCANLVDGAGAVAGGPAPITPRAAAKLTDPKSLTGSPDGAAGVGSAHRPQSRSPRRSSHKDSASGANAQSEGRSSPTDLRSRTSSPGSSKSTKTKKSVKDEGPAVKFAKIATDLQQQVFLASSQAAAVPSPASASD